MRIENGELLDTKNTKELEQLLDDRRKRQTEILDQIRPDFEDDSPYFETEYEEIYYNLNMTEEEKDIALLGEDIRRIELEIEKRKRIEVEQSIEVSQDLSILSHNEDTLDYSRFARILCDKIETASLGTHIGVMGEWGSGKSFLLNLIEKNLKQDGSNVTTVRFNASVGDSDELIWYSLLSKVSEVYSPTYKLNKVVRFIFTSLKRKGVR